MSDTADTGTRDTGETGDTGAEPSEGTVEAGPAEEVILEVDGREIDVTADPDELSRRGRRSPINRHRPRPTATPRAAPGSFAAA
jgi:hypothetical protein